MPSTRTSRDNFTKMEDTDDRSESSSESPPTVVEETKLKRSIGLFSATTMLTANVGGTGVFIAATSILYYGGSPGMAIVLWIVSGLINAGLAFCFTEVALIIPKTGGMYVYIHEIFGHIPAFVFIWGHMWMIIAPAWALGGYAASLYIVKLAFPDCEPPDVALKLLATWLMVTLMFLNCLYMKVVTKVQSILSSCKVVAMLLVIGGGMYKLADKTYRENVPQFWEGTTTDPGSIALGLVSGYFSYGGWQVITILMEEIKHPARNVPRSLGLTFLIVIILYAVTNFSYFVVLSTEETLQSDAVAVMFANRIHPALSFIMSILVALCCVNVLSVLILAQPRIIFAAAQNGHMPALFGMLNTRYSMPWPATFFLSIPSLIMLYTGTVVSLIDTMSVYSCIMVSAVLVALLYLRWTKPNANRPMKLPVILPIVELVLALALVFLSVYKKPKELGVCLAIIAAGIPVYCVCIWWKSKPKAFTSFMDRGTLFMKTLLKVETPSH